MTKPSCRYESPVAANFITKTVLKLANLPSIQLAVALSSLLNARDPSPAISVDRAFCCASWQIGSIGPLPRLDSKRSQAIQQRHLSALGVKVFLLWELWRLG
ncbi:hypothetical protein [Microcoleus sp. OTE_8_concoct_300]|uniref:hypothetical protein n=1 Tax=Microcoleus sp. OTE_8_concoct_300 TaxID=2964710 RepID=UPI00403F583C